jgi:hypothetical protein
MSLLPLPSCQRNTAPPLFFATLQTLIMRKSLQFKGFLSELFGLALRAAGPN